MTNNTTKIEAAARYCAECSAKAARFYSRQEAAELMPRNPLDGDWEYLEDQLGREATPEEMRLFVVTWLDAMDL